MIDWHPILLTLKLASITAVLLFIIATPLAYWLAFTKNKFKPIIETLVSMPLILPPTVIGYYLLISLGPTSGIGIWADKLFGIELIFSFEGLVVSSLIYSLPFMVHPIQSGFVKINQSIIDASYLLGKSKFRTLIAIILPNIRPSIITGVILTFAHTLGEFGLVLMIGGNIPEKTRVASIAIFDEVEALNYEAANTYSLILFAISFIILMIVYIVNGKNFKRI